MLWIAGSTQYAHKPFILLYNAENSGALSLFRKGGSSPKKFLMVFGFVLPCVAIIGCYSAIFARVRQSRRNVQQHSSNSNNSNPQQQQQQQHGVVWEKHKYLKKNTSFSIFPRKIVTRCLRNRPRLLPAAPSAGRTSGSQRWCSPYSSAFWWDLRTNIAIESSLVASKVRGGKTLSACSAKEKRCHLSTLVARTCIKKASL